MSKLEFERDIDNVLAYTDELGLWIVCGWTLPISKEMAIEYVNSYNSHPNKGFFEINDSIVLTHNDGKITFNKAEGNAIIDLIKAAYMGL
jgi:hypothetical protein